MKTIEARQLHVQVYGNGEMSTPGEAHMCRRLGYGNDGTDSESGLDTEKAKGTVSSWGIFKLTYR